MTMRLKQIGLFLVACITSPCCTLLIVPLLLAALAGTPLAIWLGLNLGWVYGGLTLVSVVSLVLGLRQINRRRASVIESSQTGTDATRRTHTERMPS